MKKYFLTGFLLLFSFLSVFAQYSGSGSGTENDPYLIFNADELSQIRNFLNNEKVYFKLMDDINLEEWISENNPNQGWSPIGNSSSHFMGHFDGNNKEISGLSINRSSIQYVGLFGYVEKANIDNLSINGDITGKDYVGVLAGYSFKAIFSNIQTSGTVIGENFIGGLTGCIDDKSSQTDGQINNIEIHTIIKGSDYVGGLSGLLSNCTTEDVRVNGDVIGNSNVGGVVGRMYLNFGNTLLFENVKMYGNVSGTTLVGGIIGNYEVRIGEYKLNKIMYSGNVTGTEKVGGIIGSFKYTDHFNSQGISKLNNSTVIGKIKASNNYSGGILGFSEGSNGGNWCRTALNITNCYFNGYVKGYDNVGGIAGQFGGGTMSFNYSNAKVIGNDNVGGLAGLLFGIWNGDNHYGGYSTTYRESRMYVKSNISANQQVVSIGYNAGRIFGAAQFNKDKDVIGITGTSEENKCLSVSSLIINGKEIEVVDDDKNGTNTSLKSLKSASTYTGLGWDFSTNDWTILETECFPYKTWQTAPPVISSELVSGATNIKGKSVEGGNVTVQTGDESYNTTCTNNDWSVNVSPLQAGNTVSAFARISSKEQSYMVMEDISFSGKGTLEDPFLVYSSEDLQGIGKKGYYKLMNDIDLTSWISTNQPIYGWIPIGKSNGLSINFDGNNHKIIGLWTNSTDNYTGLFDNLSNGTIKDLTVEIATGKKIHGGNYSGSLVARLANSQITNCKVIGDLEGETAKDSTIVGGLVAYSTESKIVSCSIIGNITAKGKNGRIGGLIGLSISDNIEKSYIEGDIIGDGESTISGGLIGLSNSTIAECSTKGDISSTSSLSIAGGLVGQNQQNGTIKDCYSTANVTGNNYAGGLVGYNYGEINKCYANGNVYSDNTSAGIIGYNDGVKACISNSVASNRIVSTSSSSGIAIRVLGGIRNNAPAPEKNNFAYKDMQVSINGVPKNVKDDLLNGYAKTDIEIKSQSLYENILWNFSKTWGIYEGVGMPYLLYNAPKQQPQTVTLPTIGDLTYGNPNITLPITTDQGLTISWSSSNSSVAQIANNIITIVGAGNFVITGTQTGNEEFLPLESSSVNITVAKATLNISANNQTREFGQKNPDFTLSFDGFVNGENENVLDELPKTICAANENSEMGDYDIVVYGGKDNNYEYVYHNGTLTITQSSGVDDIISSNKPVDVYSTSGVKVRSKVISLRGIAPGVYIINKKKIIIK